MNRVIWTISSFIFHIVMVITAVISMPHDSSADNSFVPQEVLVTTDSLIDYEFNEISPAFVWMNKSYELWIGMVDRETGYFEPSDGKAILVDTNLVYKGNGPEWVSTPQGNRIVYTKRLPNKLPGLAQARLVNGIWVTENLDNGQLRINPSGTSNPHDVPCIFYLLLLRNGSQVLAWRELDNPATEKRIPMSDGATGARWVNGKRAIVFTAPLKEGGRQAFLYDCDADQTEQLTFDSGNKQTIFMWRAPELNYEYVFFTSVKFRQMSLIRIYRKIKSDYTGVSSWQVVKTLMPDQTYKYFWSPELFVYNGKSYIFTVASNDPDHLSIHAHTKILLYDLIHDATSFQTLSNEQSRLRIDPEVFITDNGPLVYFNRYLPDVESDEMQYEGVYYVDTGIGQ